MTAVTTRTGRADAERARFARRAQQLAGFSVAYNVVEAVVAIGAGMTAGSVALIGFGVDSTIEMASALIILWQFRAPVPADRERAALRAMAVSFFVLATYVTFESVRALATGADPDPSTVGIVVASLSLIVMPVLSRAQRRTGRALGSDAVVADSTQTLLCTYLSAALLAGLVVNATLGWSWADPVAGLVIAAVATREGVEAWRGHGCCGPAGSAPTPTGCAGDTSRRAARAPASTSPCSGSPRAHEIVEPYSSDRSSPVPARSSTAPDAATPVAPRVVSPSTPRSPTTSSQHDDRRLDA